MKGSDSVQDWIRLPMKLLQDDRLSKSDVVIAAYIIDKCEESEIKLSTVEIAKACNVSRMQATRSIKQLISCNYIAATAQNTYKQLSVLPPKKRKFFNNEEQQEYRQRKRKSELEKLRKEQEATEDIAKYEEFINQCFTIIPDPEPEQEEKLSTVETVEEQQKTELSTVELQEIKFTDPELQRIQQQLLSKKGI